MGGNQVKNNATLWSNLQDCKTSSRVEIPKLDPSVSKTSREVLTICKISIEVRVVMTVFRMFKGVKALSLSLGGRGHE